MEGSPASGFTPVGCIPIADEISPSALARLPRGRQRTQALVDLGIREAQRRGWNDTYTFTKWIGEQIACREMSGARRSPSCARPSSRARGASQSRLKRSRKLMCRRA